MNSLLDLGTFEFEMNFSGKTAHNGAISGAQKNYVQTRFFPRNIGPVPRSGFSGLFLEKPLLIFVVGQRGSCGLKELNLY